MNNEDNDENENDSGREVGKDGRMIIESMLSSLLAVVAKSQSERTKEVLVRFFGTVLGSMVTIEAMKHRHEPCDVNELLSQLIRARDEGRESMKRHVAKGGSLQKTWHPLMDMEAAEAASEVASMASMFDLTRVFDVSAKPKIVNALVEMPNPDIDRMDGHPGMA